MVGLSEVRARIIKSASLVPPEAFGIEDTGKGLAPLEQARVLARQGAVCSTARVLSRTTNDISDSLLAEIMAEAYLSKARQWKGVAGAFADCARGIVTRALLEAEFYTASGKL